MTKKYLIYCLVVIVFITGLNFVLPLQLYGTDGYYFWGLASYILEGKLENSNAFWTLYPAGFSFILSLIRMVLPWLDYKEAALSLLMLIFCAGPWIFHKAYRRLELTFQDCLFFFFFSAAGFYVASYYIEEVMAPQVFGYLILAIFPALFFSKRKRDLKLAIILILTLYLVHSMTVFIILFATAISAIFPATRKRAKYFFLLLSPFIFIKIVHWTLIITHSGETDFFWFPFNNILQMAHLNTSYRILTESMTRFLPYEFILSGAPLFFWLIFLIFKKENRKTPELFWFFTLFLICLGITINYKYWFYLFPIGWPLERYFGFMWLSIALSLPYIYQHLKSREKLLLKVCATLFILFGIGTAFWRVTRINPENADLLAWIEGMKSMVAVDEGPILFLFGPESIPYAYSTFAPHDIFFLFPAHQPKEWSLNLKNNTAGFYLEKPLASEMDRILQENNISLIVYGKEFNEQFSELNFSKRYSLVSDFNGLAYAYDLSKID